MTATKIALIVFLSVGTFAVTGCDSGGSSETNDTPDATNDEPNSVEKADAVMVSLDEDTSSSKSKVKGPLIVDFHYENDSESDCTLSKKEKGVSPGYNEEFSPSNIEGNCKNISDFDAVQAFYKANSKAPRMKLEIRTAEDGELITYTSSDNVKNGITASRTVTDSVSLPDVGDGIDNEDDNSGDDSSGGDGSGDDVSGGENTFDDASDVASTISGLWRTPDDQDEEWVRINQRDTGRWFLGRLGGEDDGCELGFGIFDIIDANTIDFSPQDEEIEADISYSDGTLTIDRKYGYFTVTLVRPDGDKDPFQDRCDFSDDIYDALGY